MHKQTLHGPRRADDALVVRRGRQRRAPLASGKVSAGGRKTAYRYAGGAEQVRTDGRVPAGATPTQVRVVEGGVRVDHTTLECARLRAAATLGALPHDSCLVADGAPMFIATEETSP